MEGLRSGWQETTQGGHVRGAQVNGVVEELFAGIGINIRKMQVVFLVMYEHSQRRGGKVAVTAVCLSVGAVMVVLTSGSQPAEPGLSKAR